MVKHRQTRINIGKHEQTGVIGVKWISIGKTRVKIGENQ